MTPKAPELWTIGQVANYLGVKPGSARGQLSRWGVRRIEVGQSEAGRLTALYDASEVRAAHAARPGQGVRPDRT